MSWPALVMLAVVCVAAVLSWWNVTLRALVVAWTLAQGSWLVTGDNSPERLYVILDGIVLGIIFAKACPKRVRRYPGWLKRCAGFLNKSWGDRIVIAIFPVAWIFYTLPDSRTRWFALWALAITQFVAASGDTVAMLISRRRSGVHENRPPGSFRLVWGRVWVAS